MAGSYRDRRGYVLVAGDRTPRAVPPSAAGVQRELLDSPVFARLVDGWDRRP